MPKKKVGESKVDRHAKAAFTLRLDETLAARGRAFAEKHDRTFTRVVERALAEYLDRHENALAVEEQKTKK